MQKLPVISRIALASLGALLISPQGYAAGPPAAFDNWSGGRGGISAGCPSGFTCGSEITDAGMLQRILTNNNTGKRYIQMLLHDQMNDGTTLTSESFIQGNNGSEGIASKQTLNVSGVTTINQESVVNTGWAARAGRGTDVRITQQLSDNSMNGVGYSDSFIFESTQDANENVVGYYLDIRQEVTNSSGNATPPSGSQIEGTLSGVATGQDKHVFVTRKAAGTYTGGSGSASLPGSSGGGMMGGSGGPAGGTVSWNAGDEVQVIWIGQVCEGCQTGGGMMMKGGGEVTTVASSPGAYTKMGSTVATSSDTSGALYMGGGGGGGGSTTTTTSGTTDTTSGTTTTTSGTTTTTSGTMDGGGGGGGGMMAGGSSFSYQSYDNLSDGNGAIATRSIFQADPINWTDPFGTTPQF